MKRRTLTLTLTFSAAILAAGCAVLRAETNGRNADIIPASVYGADDRQDYYASDRTMKKFAESTVALFADTALPRDEASGGYRLKGLSLKGKYNLQDGERFAEQPVGAFCSGVLVGEDLVLTAGHCFKPDPRGGPCEKVKLVFGYALTRAGDMPSSFPAEDVYSCREVIAQKVQSENNNFTCRNGKCRNSGITGKGADYAVIRLDRKVGGRQPLAINRGKLTRMAQLAVIGYPSGLPVKVAAGGSVRSIMENGYFVADLDTFGGNSGSPVFNVATLKIEGILVRGGVDYVYDSPDSAEDPANPYLYAPGRTNTYPQEGGLGEDVTLIGEVQALIPRTEAEMSMAGAQQRQAEQPRDFAAPVPSIYMPGQDGVMEASPDEVPAPPSPEPAGL